MALQTSGAISLNDLHLEAGGTTGTQVSMNDTDIRDMIDKASGAQQSMSEYYGASSIQYIAANIIGDFAVMGGGGYHTFGSPAGSGGGAGGMVWYSDGSGMNGSSTNTSLRPYRGTVVSALEVGTYSLTVGSAGSPQGGTTTLTFPSGAVIKAIGGGAACSGYYCGGNDGGSGGGGSGSGGSAITTGTEDYAGNTGFYQGYNGGRGSGWFSGVAAGTAGGGAGGAAQNGYAGDGSYATPCAGPGINIGGRVYGAGASPQHLGTCYSYPGTRGSAANAGGVVFNHTTNGRTEKTSSGTFTISSNGTIS